MGKFIYRMCLFVGLMVVLAGGVYYYMTAYDEEELEDGTFVDRFDEDELEGYAA